MSEQLIYGDETRLLPWALTRIGLHAFRRDAYAIGLERNGELVAVAVYDNFSACDCNMHIASDGSGHWLSKKLLAAVFAYPFGQLGFRRVTALVPSKNLAALRFDQNIGFVYEGLHRDALPDDHLISLGLLRGDCRFFHEETPR